MAAVITSPVAGAYVGTYNAIALGMMNDDGFIIGYTPVGQDLNDTDQFGGTLIEGVYRGGNFRVRSRTKEWNTGMQGAFQVYGKVSAGVAPSFALGIVGRKYSAIAQALLLTATAGTPAAAAPATLTVTQALLAPNTNLDIGFTSKIREVPLEWICLPYTVSSDTVPFTTT